MEILTFRCSECGYSKEIFGGIDDIVRCELCGNLMDLEDIEKATENLKEKVNKGISMTELGKIIAVEGMQKNLETLGNDKTWQLLEELFINPKTRLRYRKIFFESGGIFPEKELKLWRRKNI